MSTDIHDLRGDPESVSNCCGARVTMQGLCEDCGEHCTDERDEEGPTDAQQEISHAGAEASEARYREQMKDAGRGHLLP